MVAELSEPGTLTGTLTAMMLLLAVGTTFIAMVASLVCGLRHMWKQEKRTEVREFFEYLPTVRIAYRRGTKYHRRNCGIIRNQSIAGAAAVRDFAPCFQCFPERYVVQETKKVNMRCYGMAAGIVLLIGFLLGCLATYCGMTRNLGMMDADVEPWRALDYVQEKREVKDELALGGRAFEDVPQEDRARKEKLERKEIRESDESELMATWSSISRSPNTQWNSIENFENLDDRNGYPIQFMNVYTIQFRNFVGEFDSQESVSLESGYAPRCLVKQEAREGNLLALHQQGQVLRWFERCLKGKLAKVESLFHDVVHEIFHGAFSNTVMFQGIRLVVYTGTPLGLVTWIILMYFSQSFCQAVRSRRKKPGKKTREQRRAAAVHCRQYKSLLLATLVYSNLEAAKGMEEALKTLAEANMQTLQGIQALSQEIRHSAAAGSQREEGLTRAFQETVAAVQQKQAESQEALVRAQQEAVTTCEEIGSSLERAVKERKPGDVELHKLIKAPEAFNPGTWQEEKSGFGEFRNRLRTWLGALDENMVRIMDRVEKNLKEDKAVTMSEMSTEAREASRRLYSVLSSYTKGRPFRVVKHVQEQNGMEAYRMLMKEYQPVNRARSLELFHNVLNYRFVKEKGIAENILEYEEKIELYEKATGEKVQENLM